MVWGCVIRLRWNKSESPDIEQVKGNRSIVLYHTGSTSALGEHIQDTDDADMELLEMVELKSKVSFWCHVLISDIVVFIVYNLLVIYIYSNIRTQRFPRMITVPCIITQPPSKNTPIWGTFSNCLSLFEVIVNVLRIILLKHRLKTPANFNEN